MNVLMVLMGLLLAVSADLAIGLFITFLFLKWWGGGINIAGAYLIGLFFCCFPDTDVLWQKLLKGTIMSDHRNLLHYPIIIVPFFFMLSIFSIFYAILASFCLLSHYIHDSMDIETNGAGVMWLAPFSYSQYLFSFKKGIRKLSNEEIKLRREANSTLFEWLNKYYLCFNLNSFFGAMLLLLACYFVF